MVSRIQGSANPELLALVLLKTGYLSFMCSSFLAGFTVGSRLKSFEDKPCYLSFLHYWHVPPAWLRTHSLLL